MSASLLPRHLEPSEVESWVEQPGRWVLWFHSPCDGPGVMAMNDWRQLPEEVRERVPLRVVVIDDIPGAIWHEFATRWSLRHMSEITIWESGQLIWRGVPQAGPGRDWQAWLEKWNLG